MYEEIVKPNKLSDSDVPLYCMYANGWDYKDKMPRFKEITCDRALEIAYKVYKEV
jgi:hypothetical protein